MSQIFAMQIQQNLWSVGLAAQRLPIVACPVCQQAVTQRHWPARCHLKAHVRTHKISKDEAAVALNQILMERSDG